MLALMVEAVVWHFWIAPILVLTVVAVLVATMIGYWRKVSSPRYPRS